MMISTEPTLGIRLVLLISPERKAMESFRSLHLAVCTVFGEGLSQNAFNFSIGMKAVNF